MKDHILSAYMQDFVKQFGLGEIDEGRAFESLVGHCIVSKHNPENFEPDDVLVGGYGDLGIDAIGILVNDHLVHTDSDVDYFKDFLRRLDVQFVFVQAKTSPNFKAIEIGTFISGVRQFFDSSPATANESVLALHKLKEYVFDHSIDMDSSPICRLYYVTTGRWTDDLALSARIDQGVNDLENTNLFSRVEFTPVDSGGLKRVYRELNQRITREIKFEKHTILPRISGVQEAYIGILPCSEYLKLISDDHGNLNQRLFYDNVRDFQGHNAVNKEIEDTVKDTVRNDRLALLNNGVTIVGRDINQVGETFRLRDYQVVNGCQTSHILHLNKDRLTDRVFLPVKLIVTKDAEVTNQIIQGTNRQTEVKLEAFESLAPFQKELEELYLAVGRNRHDPIYYERRSKQYEQGNIRRDRIITLATQVKCFVAMFLNEPQSTHRYYGELLRSRRNRLFSDSHAHRPYFVAGVALNTVERLFATGFLRRELRGLKYHFLLVFRLMNEPFRMPSPNGKEIDKYCRALLEILDDESAYKSAFVRAGQIIRSCQQKMSLSLYEVARSRAFTSALMATAANSEQSEIAVASATSTRFTRLGKTIQ